MAGILTKDMSLAYGTEGSKKVLTNLMEIPEIGNNAPEKIDVTVLTDDVKKSISGLGDSAQDLAFKFLYEEEQFTDLDELANSENPSTEWQVTIPKSQIKATFTGTPSVKLGAAAPNGALTYTLNISVESKIVFA
jgi:hypothetical protein